MRPVATRPIATRSTSTTGRPTNLISAASTDSNAGMLSRLRAALSDVRFGEVTILVQDGQIIRIDIENRRRVDRIESDRMERR